MTTELTIKVRLRPVHGDAAIAKEATLHLRSVMTPVLDNIRTRVREHTGGPKLILFLERQAQTADIALAIKDLCAAWWQTNVRSGLHGQQEIQIDSGLPERTDVYMSRNGNYAAVTVYGEGLPAKGTTLFYRWQQNSNLWAEVAPPPEVRFDEGDIIWSITTGVGAFQKYTWQTDRWALTVFAPDLFRVYAGMTALTSKEHGIDLRGLRGESGSVKSAGINITRRIETLINQLDDAMHYAFAEHFDVRWP